LVNLRPLEHLFGDCEWPERGLFLQARRRAREHALEVLDGGSGEGEVHTALLVAATELFSALGAARAVFPRQAAHLVERLEDGVGLSRAELAREVLRVPELLSLPPTVAIEAQLGMLMAFAPLRSASLWRLDSAERVNCACHVGEGAPSMGAQQLARQLLAGPRAQNKLVHGRIEDLDAQLVALDGELRRLASEVQAASVLLNRPFPVALRNRVQAFTLRTGIKPRLRLAGDMSLVSTSQQIALLNIIQEALSNVREHAHATKVQIVVSSSRNG